MNKIIIVIIFILVLTLPKAYVVLKSNYCLYSDCAFYLFNMRYNMPKVDAFFFVVNLLHYLARFFGEVLVAKAFPIIANIIMLLGIYLLIKDKFDFNMTLITLGLINFSLGLLRVWFDMYRNLFALMMIPYFIYAIIKDKWYAGLLLGLLIIAHFSSIMFIPVTFLYLLFYKKYKKLGIAIALTLLVFFLYYSFGNNQIYADRNAQILVKEPALSYQMNFMIGDMFQALANFNLKFFLNNLYFTFYFGSVIFIFGIFSLLYFDKKDKLFVFMVIYAFFFIVMLFTNITAPNSKYYAIDRATMLSNIPFAILSIYFLKNQKGRMQLLCLIMLLVFVTFGITTLVMAISYIEPYETDFVSHIDVPNDSVIVVPSRGEWLLRYFADNRYKIVAAEIHEIFGEIPKNNDSMLFNSSFEESSKAIENIKLNYNVSQFYIYYNLEYDWLNVSTIESLAFANRIELLNTTGNISFYRSR